MVVYVYNIPPDVSAILAGLEVFQPGRPPRADFVLWYATAAEGRDDISRAIISCLRGPKETLAALVPV